MEFKEVIKIRNRMCDYYKSCDGCPLEGATSGCISRIAEVENADQYERIIENWAKEHPVVTNVDKFVEAIKNTFSTKLNENQMSQVRRTCVKAVVGLNVACNTMYCSDCLKWWDKEYREPAKEKEEWH